MRITFHVNIDLCDPFEYFCTNCRAMNLSYAALVNCGDCNTPITIKGKPGELDLKALRAKYGTQTNPRMG
jgi:DNA-directed RNA polymerase subunit RPC12/RpoP